MPMLDSYLFFDGKCADAMKFYQKTIGGELMAMMKYSESPDPESCGAGPGASQEARDRIMHAHLLIEGRNLMASDTPAHMEFKGAGNISVSLSGTDEAALSGYWTRLKDGAEILQPLEKAPWGDSFGMLADKFGVVWLVNITGAK